MSGGVGGGRLGRPPIPIMAFYSFSLPYSLPLPLRYHSSISHSLFFLFRNYKKTRLGLEKAMATRSAPLKVHVVLLEETPAIYGKHVQ
jgi:hypothetical protein